LRIAPAKRREHAPEENGVLNGFTIALLLIAALQAILGFGVLRRFVRTARGVRVKISTTPQSETISVLLPVLNESNRIASCLGALVALSEEVPEILVVDGGSTDGTQSIVGRYAARDRRVRLIDASPVADSWTGKAWGLFVGLQRANPESKWILCVDADVQVSPMLARSLLAHAREIKISSFSIATRQRLSGRADALLHPALLTTLVYRFGIPGRATRDPNQVQANGQCFFAERAVLLRTDAFQAAQMSLCEDITIARRIAECGDAVGFYEADDLIEVTMYSSWRELWRNWPRSLPMRDQYFGATQALRLLEVLFVQALPLPLLTVTLLVESPPWLFAMNLLLAVTRLGVMAGISRAYVERPWTFWLSPLFDLPVALRLIESALRRKHTWRGRTYVRRSGGGYGLLKGSG
jgi:dolichol-phosphate mannosyltransferase